MYMISNLVNLPPVMFDLCVPLEIWLTLRGGIISFTESEYKITKITIIKGEIHCEAVQRRIITKYLENASDLCEGQRERLRKLVNRPMH